MKVFLLSGWKVGSSRTRGKEWPVSHGSSYRWDISALACINLKMVLIDSQWRMFELTCGRRWTRSLQTLCHQKISYELLSVLLDANFFSLNERVQRKSVRKWWSLDWWSAIDRITSAEISGSLMRNSSLQRRCFPQNWISTGFFIDRFSENDWESSS